MAGYDNMFGGRPSNNSMWIGNNYSTTPGYAQMPRNNYSSMNQNGMMPSNPMQNFQPQSQSINNVLEVMGPESAQAFQIGPDSKVILMDANKPIFYCKQSDSSGFAATKAFHYEEVPLTELMQSSVQSHEDDSIKSDYITKSEFNEFKKMIEELVMKDE